jgi:predicted homoserine dehydrogenase-like protein
MNLATLATEVATRNCPVRVELIGAGKFGSMFLSQVPTIAGIEVTAIAELDHARMVAACTAVGWDAERINALSYEESGAELAMRDDVDVVIEATGNPHAGTEQSLYHTAIVKYGREPSIQLNILTCQSKVG